MLSTLALYWIDIPYMSVICCIKNNIFSTMSRSGYWATHHLSSIYPAAAFLSHGLVSTVQPGPITQDNTYVWTIYTVLPNVCCNLKAWCPCLSSIMQCKYKQIKWLLVWMEVGLGYIKHVCSTHHRDNNVSDITWMQTKQDNNSIKCKLLYKSRLKSLNNNLYLLVWLDAFKCC